MSSSESDKLLLIIARRSPDWARLTDAEFKEESTRFCRESNMPETLVYDAACLWDRTFCVTYLETRQRMKEIARENWARLHGSVISETLPVGAAGVGAVTFVDDDDWYHPDIARYLFASFDDCEGLIWDHLRIGHVKGEALEYRSEATSTVLCYTNNYAVAPAALDALGFDRLYHHLNADETFASLKIGRIPLALSATNKHAASTLVLHAMLSEDSSSSALISGLDKYLSRVSNVASNKDGQFRWLIPSLEKVLSWFETVRRTAKRV